MRQVGEFYCHASRVSSPVVGAERAVASPHCAASQQSLG